ncbi:MAG: LCP family protein [Patescibacteria group bacterium]
MPDPDLSFTKVNLLPTDEEKRIRRHTMVLAVVFTLSVAGVAALGANASYRAANHGTSTVYEMARLPFISDIQRMVSGSGGGTTQPNGPKKLSNRMNILILGIGGEGHEGSLLTDTMLLASIDTKDKRVAMLSIPRDLAYPLGEGRFEKINAVHAYEEMEHPGEGAKRTGELVSNLFDTPIDHVVRINFRGFVALVDAVGGIDVTVERGFTDASYPTEDDKWMTVSFKKGKQHMNGERALIYTRSRHGNAGEGSDFARSRRQQIVLLALRDKFLSLGTLADPQKLASVYGAISNNVQSDLNVWDLMKLAPLAQDFSADKITLNVPTDAPDSILTPANVAGAFMLFPRKPDWSELRELAQNPFATPVEATATKPAPAHLTIEVRNGTARTNFASQVAVKLEKNGFEINGFGNASRRGYERTVVYDLTNGKKMQEIVTLKKLLGADVATVDQKNMKTLDGSQIRTFMADSQTVERVYAQDTDFVVVLGEASYSLLSVSPDVTSYATPSNQ